MNNKEEIKNDIEVTESNSVAENIDNNEVEALILEYVEDNDTIGEALKEVQDEEVKEMKKKSTFGSNLLASILDQVFCVGISIIILFITSAIINMFGYRFVLLGNYNMFFIIYILVNILYNPIIMASKLKNTFGRTLLKL